MGPSHALLSDIFIPQGGYHLFFGESTLSHGRMAVGVPTSQNPCETQDSGVTFARRPALPVGVSPAMWLGLPVRRIPDGWCWLRGSEAGCCRPGWAAAAAAHSPKGCCWSPKCPGRLQRAHLVPPGGARCGGRPTATRYKDHAIGKPRRRRKQERPPDMRAGHERCRLRWRRQPVRRPGVCLSPAVLPQELRARR